MSAEICECPICREELKDLDLAISECKHKFHFNCLFRWIKKSNTCPICRQQLVCEEKELPRVYEGVFMIDRNTINVHGTVFRFENSCGGTYSGIESYISLIQEYRNNNPIPPVADNRTYAQVAAGVRH